MRLQLTCGYSSRYGFSLGFLTSQFANLKYSCARLALQTTSLFAFFAVRIAPWTMYR